MAKTAKDEEIEMKTFFFSLVVKTVREKFTHKHEEREKEKSFCVFFSDMCTNDQF